MNLRQRIQQFMYGRYGYDQLGRSLIVAALVCMVLGLFVPRAVYPLFLALQYAALIFCIFRVLSRNVYKRRQENAWYMQKEQTFRQWLRSLKDRWQQRKDYKFFRCPSCHALLRVPRGKGKLVLTCRKCGNRFERKT